MGAAIAHYHVMSEQESLQLTIKVWPICEDDQKRTAVAVKTCFQTWSALKLLSATISPHVNEKVARVLQRRVTKLIETRSVLEKEAVSQALEELQRVSNYVRVEMDDEHWKNIESAKDDILPSVLEQSYSMTSGDTLSKLITTALDQWIDWCRRRREMQKEEGQT